MRTINKHKNIILDWFYLDEDDMTIRRAKDGYRGRYTQHDVVAPYQLCSHGYGGVHVPTTRTTVAYHHLLTILRGIDIPNDAVIDHLDGDTENNSRDNLRVTTQSINCKNTVRKKSNTSGVTGINWNNASGSFVVRKQLNGKRVYLGHRKTLAEAKELLDSHTDIILADGYTKRHGKDRSTTIPNGSTSKWMEAPSISNEMVI